LTENLFVPMFKITGELDESYSFDANAGGYDVAAAAAASAAAAAASAAVSGVSTAI
jgi:hypothetical protein